MARRQIRTMPCQSMSQPSDLKVNDHLFSSGFSSKLLQCNCLSPGAGSEEPWKKIVFHGSPVEAVVELGDIAFQVACLYLVVGSEQNSLRIRQRDMRPGEERVGRFFLA